MGSRHGDEMLGAFQTDRIVASFDERFKIAPRSAAEVEYCKRGLALDVLQQRFNILADVVMTRTFPELFGTLIVILQCESGDFFRSCGFIIMGDLITEDINLPRVLKMPPP